MSADGLVGDIEWANIKGDDGGLGGVTDQLKNEWRGSFRGRVGFAWDRFLVYGTGGLAVADLKYSLIALPPVNESESITTTSAGWTAGGGAEYAFSPAWSAFVDYRYTDFGTHSDRFPGGAAIVAQTISYRYRDSAVRGGISFHFGK
jgi:outer membrane immunogenic protein